MKFVTYVRCVLDLPKSDVKRWTKENAETFSVSEDEVGPDDIVGLAISDGFIGDIDYEDFKDSRQL